MKYAGACKMTILIVVEYENIVLIAVAVDCCYLLGTGCTFFFHFCSAHYSLNGLKDALGLQNRSTYLPARHYSPAVNYNCSLQTAIIPKEFYPKLVMQVVGVIQTAF